MLNTPGYMGVEVNSLDQAAYPQILSLQGANVIYQDQNQLIVEVPVNSDLPAQIKEIFDIVSQFTFYSCIFWIENHPPLMHTDKIVTDVDNGILQQLPNCQITHRQTSNLSTAYIMPKTDVAIDASYGVYPSSDSLTMRVARMRSLLLSPNTPEMGEAQILVEQIATFFN